jgi:hypothetical protein
MVDCGTRARHVTGVCVPLAEGLPNAGASYACGREVFGAREIGRLLGVRPRTVYTIAAKRGPIFKLGGRLAARRSALAEFLENFGENKAAADAYGAPVALAAALIARMDLDISGNMQRQRAGVAGDTQRKHAGHNDGSRSSRPGLVEEPHRSCVPSGARGLDNLALQLVMHRIADDLSASCCGHQPNSKRARLARRAGMHHAITAAIGNARLYLHVCEALSEMHRP